MTFFLYGDRAAPFLHFICICMRRIRM
jgi:hypothetical protein